MTFPNHYLSGRCPALFADAATGPRCDLPSGHEGRHVAHVLWGEGEGEDDAPTAKLPPIRDTVGVRRRPPVPEVRELSDRAELLEVMVRELRRELRELPAEDGEDGEECGAVAHSPLDPSVTWECGLERGHQGLHEVHGRTWR